MDGVTDSENPKEPPKSKFSLRRRKTAGAGSKIKAVSVLSTRSLVTPTLKSRSSEKGEVITGIGNRMKSRDVLSGKVEQPGGERREGESVGRGKGGSDGGEGGGSDGAEGGGSDGGEGGGSDGGEGGGSDGGEGGRSDGGEGGGSDGGGGGSDGGEGGGSDGGEGGRSDGGEGGGSDGGEGGRSDGDEGGGSHGGEGGGSHGGVGRGCEGDGREGGDRGDEHGEMYFCHMCQKDLTKFNVVRRQQHMNRCCDEAAARRGNDNVDKFTCELCTKVFTDEQVKNRHLKSCAKSQGLSTVQLLEVARGEAGTLSSNGPPPAKKQASIRSVLRKSMDDFKVPPPVKKRNRKRKTPQFGPTGSLDVEYDQLQLALAMSASLGGDLTDTHNNMCTTSGGETNATAKRKWTKRKKKEAVSHPLFSVSSQQCRDIICLRAEQLLQPASSVSGGIGVGAEGEDIPCTPAFCSSELAACVANESTVIPAPRDEDNVLFVSDDDDADDTLREGKGHTRTRTTPSHLLAPSCAGGGEMMASPGSTGFSISTPPDGDGGDGGDAIPVNEVSLVEEVRDVSYRTVWQLGSSDLHSDTLNEFYVPALASAVSPHETKPLFCRQCDSSTCLGGMPSSPPLPPTAAEEKETPPAEPVNSCRGVIDPTLFSDLHSMINSAFLSDIVVLTAPCSSGGGHGTLRAHRCLLAARCPGFREAIRNTEPLPNVLDLSDFEGGSVLGFLEYVYTGVDPSVRGKVAVNEVDAITSRMSFKEEVSKIIRYCVHMNDIKAAVDHGSVALPSPCSLQPSPPSSSSSLLFSPPSQASLDAQQLLTPAMVQSRTPSPNRDDLKSSPLSDESLLDEGDPHISDEIFHVVTPSPHFPPDVSPSFSMSDYHSVGGEEKVGLALDSHSSSPGSDVILCRVSPSQQTFDRVGLGEVVEGIGGEEGMEVVREDTHELEVEGDLNMVDGVEEVGVKVKDVDEVKMDETTLDVMGLEENVVVQAELSGDSASDAPVPLMGEDYHFDVDWLLDGMADDVTGNGSYHESPPRPLLRSSQDRPSCHSSTPPTPLSDLNQTPVQPVKDSAPFVTPASIGERRTGEVYSDDSITPMPAYHAMQTPQLKGECKKFGVRAIPKRKMIAKLREIYTYTHPLVADDGAIVPEGNEAKEDVESIRTRVKHAITSDHDLHQDILLYKPLDISFIQAKLKSAGVILTKDNLMDVLDFLCVTFTVPRNNQRHQK